MRTFAPKQNVAQPASSIVARPKFPTFASPDRTLSVQRTDQAEEQLLPATTTRFAHEFSRIPVRAQARIQPKLAVNTPGDSYEQEADRTAKQVMSMSEPLRRSPCSCGDRCPGCRNAQASHERLQTRSFPTRDPGQLAAPPIVNDVLRSPGQPLDPSLRAFMEPRFGRDFSQVRVHKDAQAQESAEAVSALAYTVGRHVVFGPGQYQPDTTAGRELLAHELTHTLQQGNGFQTRSTISDMPAPVYGQTGAGIMRQLKRQPNSGIQVEDSNQNEPKDTVPNDESIKSDLNKLKSLKISGSTSGAAADVQTLSQAIGTTFSVIKRMGRTSGFQQGVQELTARVSALRNVLGSTEAVQLGTANERLAGVSAASFTGTEPIGWLVVLEILGEILAAIAAVLEAVIVIIILVIVLVIWLIYEIIMAIIKEADRSWCIWYFERRCKPPNPCRDCLGMCIENEGEWPLDKCPINR